MTRHPIVPLLIVGLGTLVVPLDSAVNIGFPAIVTHFALPIPMIQWIIIAYVLTQTALMLSFGRLGDLFGYRRVFLIGTGLSTIAFAACALAPSYPALVAARVLQGIAAGLILSVGPALATSLYPEAQRTRVLARYMMMFGIGTALGPLAFGPLVQHFGWSAVFSFRAPVAAASFALAWTLPAPGRGLREPFDIAGGILLAVGLAFMLLTLNRLHSFGPEVLLFAAIAAGGFLLFYRHETRTAKPIIDFRHFRQPGFAAINLSNAVVNVAGFSIMLLAPFYLARLPDLTLPMAGLVLATSPVGIVIAAPVAERLAHRHAPGRITLIGTALSAAGLFGISLAPNIPTLAAAMFAQGIGLGLFQVAYFDIVTAAIPAQNRGVAGSLGMVTRSIGVVTAATVLMLVFQSLGTAEPDSFLPAFRTTFRIAAAIALGTLTYSRVALKR